MGVRLSAGLLAASWCATAHAAVHIDGTELTADGYTVLLQDDAAGVGGPVRTNGGDTVASRLAVHDGDPSCVTATRACAIVVDLPEWILRQCDRTEQCTDTDTLATTWQSFWSSDATVATWLRWQDAGAAPTLHSLLSTSLPVASDTQVTWWQDPSVPGQSTAIELWSLSACAPPLALSLPTAAGTFHLAAVGWDGIAPVSCDADASTGVALDLARITPQTGTAAALFAAMEIGADPATAVAALDRLLTSPTAQVTVGSRWMVDDDDLLDGLGVATLAMDADEQRVVWIAAPADGRARPRVRYLVRGVAAGRQPTAYRAGELVSGAHPLPLAGARSFNAAREWQPWQSTDTVCLQNNQWCYEAISPFPFSGLEVQVATPASGLAAEWQYWNGAAWSELTLTGGVVDLAASGTVRWDIPNDWQPSATELDGASIALYAVRLRSNPGFGGVGATLSAVAPDLLLFTPDAPITEPTELRLTFNQRPIASTAAANIDIAPDQTARLDGGPSFDPDGTPVTYAWHQSSGPANAVLTSANDAVATARLPESGLYVFALVVSDGTLESAPAFVVVRAGTFASLERGCDCSVAPPWTLVFVVLALRRRQGRTVK